MREAWKATVRLRGKGMIYFILRQVTLCLSACAAMAAYDSWNSGFHKTTILLGCFALYGIIGAAFWDFRPGGKAWAN